MNVTVPFHLPTIEEEEIDEVVATLRSGWLTTGPKTAQFEAEFKQYVGAPHALALNSATAALHVALAALRVGAGDEVITTPLTFCATVNTIMHVGATPVLADIGPDGNIDPESIAGRITPHTRAIMPVHLGGLPCDMDAIWDLARRHCLFVVEDAAHAIGAWYRDSPVGSAHPSTGAASDAVAYSFYATKNLTTGEGGMVTTHDPHLDEAMRILCLHGISKDAWNRYSDRGNWYYEVTQCGFKYNLCDILSAVGIHQLRKQERFVEVRTRYAHMYNRAFEDVPELELPPDNPGCRHAWHLYGLRLRLDRLTITREEFIVELRKRNICASVHFIPIPLFPYFAPFAALPHNQCPNALALYPRLVSLPLYPGLREDHVSYVAQTVKDVILAARKSVPVAMPTATVSVPAV